MLDDDCKMAELDAQLSGALSNFVNVESCDSQMGGRFARKLASSMYGVQYGLFSMALKLVNALEVGT